jgi:hypothetical protein
MAVTAVPKRFWQINEHQSGRFGPEYGSEMIQEMAMKKNWILGAVTLLATLWFALDAGLAAMSLLG